MAVGPFALEGKKISDFSSTPPMNYLPQEREYAWLFFFGQLIAFQFRRLLLVELLTPILDMIHRAVHLNPTVCGPTFTNLTVQNESQDTSYSIKLIKGFETKKGAVMPL